MWRLPWPFMKPAGPLPSSFTGPVINESALEKVVQYNTLAKDEGATVLVPGDRLTDRAHADGRTPIEVGWDGENFTFTPANAEAART